MHFSPIRLAGAMLTSLLTPLAYAQPVLGPAVTNDSRPIAPGSPAAIANALNAVAQVAAPSYGPLELRPNVGYQVTYAEGLQQEPGRYGDTWIERFSAGAVLRVGEPAALAYTYNKTWYSSRFFRNTEGHNVNGSLVKTVGDTQLSGQAGYQESTDLLVETGRQTHQESYTARGNAGRAIGSRASVGLNVGYTERFTDSVLIIPEYINPEWKTWMFGAQTSYQPSPRAQATLSVSRNIAYVKVGPDVVSTTPQMELAWKPSPRLSATASVGMSYQEFSSGTEKRRSDPVYALSAGYLLGKSTSVSVSAERTTSASHFASQSALTESVQVGITQKLLQRLSVNLSYGYQYSHFRNSDLFGVPSRENHTETFSGGLSMPVFTLGSVGISYRDANNNSNYSQYTFHSRQVTFSVGYRF